MAEHHATIARTLAAFDEHLAECSPPMMSTLAAIRWQLHRELRAYQLFKHNEIFDPLCSNAGDRRARSAYRMREACLALAADVTSYYQDWSGRTTCNHEAQSEKDRNLIRRVRAHLSSEKAGIAAVLAGLDRISRTTGGAVVK